MTVTRHRRELRSGCAGDGHTWITHRYAARQGAREMRVCDACGSAEMAVPAQRSGPHTPAHMIRADAVA